MLIRGADGRLYELTASGVNAKAEAPVTPAGPRPMLGRDSADNAAGAYYAELPTPSSFP